MKVWVGVAALSALGCSAPEGCVTTYDGIGPGEQLQASISEASFELAPGEIPKSFVLEATVSKLPKLWQKGGNLLDGQVSFDFKYEYVSEPKGGDGKTEMPRVRTKITVDGEPSRFEDHTTSRFGGGWTRGGTADLFETDHQLRGFCDYGAESCSLPVGIRFERLDAEPFPAIAITWKAEASVKVSPCPLEKEVRAELTLEPSTP